MLSFSLTDTCFHFQCRTQIQPRHQKFHSRQLPLLPESAVQSDRRGNFVYIIDGGNRAQRRDVQTGQVTDKGVSIVAGLTGNERVVLSAGAFLNPGQRVKPILQTRPRQDR